jgi:hypothetical protein
MVDAKRLRALGVQGDTGAEHEGRVRKLRLWPNATTP